MSDAARLVDTTDILGHMTQTTPLMQRLVQTYWPPEDTEPWVIWRDADQPEVHAPPVEVTSVQLTWAISDQDRPAYLEKLVVAIKDPLTTDRREISCGLELGQRKPPEWVQALLAGINRLTIDIPAAVNRP